jgi:sporulation protein YlmC with PRC-barrel domain
MADNLLYLTELIGLKVFDLKGRRIGRAVDAALVPLLDPVRIDRFLVGGGWAWLTIRHDQVSTISSAGIYLRDEQLTPYHSDEYMLRMRRDLLYQQIIDVHGRKVVRVTDVTFEVRRENGHDTLHMLEVDIGVRSIFRRLVQGVLPHRWIRRLQSRIPPNSIRWEFCDILEHDPQRRLRLNLSTDKLEKMHPADLADIVEELSPEDREAIFETMDSEAAAEALSEVDPEIQARILESLETEKAADIVEEMSPDRCRRATTWKRRSGGDEEMDGTQSEVRSRSIRGTAAAENTEYVALDENTRVADGIVALRGNEEMLEVLNTLFLVDSDGRLKGAVPVARLFVADIDTPLRSLQVETLIEVNVDQRQDRVIEFFDKYNLLTLPVVDEPLREVTNALCRSVCYHIAVFFS